MKNCNKFKLQILQIKSLVLYQIIAPILFIILQITANGQPRTLPVPYTSNSVNYVRTWDAVIPETNPNNITTSSQVQLFRMSTQYVDGLGRPVETVIKQGSLATGTTAVDMVNAMEYDQYGREQYKDLPFGANNTGSNPSISDGLFKLNPFQQQAYFYSDANINTPIKGQGETYYYNQSNFESSPLNRITKSLPAGNNWVGANRGADNNYWLNTITDAVRVWSVTNNGTVGNFGSYASSTTYAAGLLYKSVTVDENGKQVIEFKDKNDRVILKKVQLTATADNGITGSSHTGWLCTYYIYDDLNNLRCVIQPRGVELIAPSWLLTDATILAEQCFRYEYDSRNRMIIKKVPGATEVYLVYDTRDRLVMTQDANMRATNKWMITLYDNLNRPIQTGLLLNTYFGATPKTFAQHLAAASPVPLPPIFLPYPFNPSTPPSITYWEKLSEFHYDDYINVPTPLTGMLNSTYINNTNFFMTQNASPDYAQLVIQSTTVKGMVTWSQAKVLGTTSQFISQVNIYDDKGKVIQVQSVNITGGVDIATTQYDFSGKIIRTHLFQQKSGGTVQTYQLATKNTYDLLGRPIKIEKNFNNAGYKVTTAPEYDALGQLKKKSLGTNPLNTSQPLETLAFDYNIRGWMLGENTDFVKDLNTTNYFGFDLGYDKNGSLSTYTPQYNGNISGTIWKSKGDNQKRKYDFTYDAANRLMAGNFRQYVSGSGTSAVFDISAGVNFSVSNLTYDANGNILTMNQNGLKLNTSPLIDQFNYTYIPNTNKLKNVRDNVNDPVSVLGDFKTSALHPQNSAKTSATTQAARDAITDYNYDANGNLTKDFNKDIATPAGADGIQYNYLNLPSIITIRKDITTGIKGTITYTYDASGNKLKKVTIDNTTTGKTITTTTNYISGFVYESKATVPVDVSNPDYIDVLQFTGHEEGRIRRKPDGTFAYDYFLKDHLGNVRMVLTEDAPVTSYPAATLEGTYDATTNSMVNYEKQFYKIDNTKITPESAIPSWVSPPESVANTKLYYNHNGNPPSNLSYPAGCAPTQLSGSNNLYKLNATTNKTGLEFVIKVMAGDKIDIFGKSYYLNTTPVSNANSTALNLLSLMTNFLLAPVNPAGGKGFTAPLLNTINSGVVPATFFRGTNNESTTQVPKAYINYIFLDEQFKYAGGNASRVGTSGTVKDHWYVDAAALQNITVPKNGYIFVYVSNESNFDVFFDNLQVIHKPGPFLEETHYYPFGLTMAGISSKAAAGVENRYKYNGYEQQSKEFSDGSGLEWYDYKHRFYDSQIGRFFTQDELASDFPYYSPYQFAGNEVPNAIDLDGLEPLRPRYMSPNGYSEQRRSYREINSYVPRSTSYRSSNTYIPNQTSYNTNTVRTPSDIYEASRPGSGEQFTGPFITKGNAQGMLAVRMTKAVHELKKNIESVTAITDHKISENSTTAGTSITITWKSKEAENSFNRLQQQYSESVNEINTKNLMPTLPGSGASQEEWSKWLTTAQEVTRTRGFAISVLGPSPMQQITNSIQSENGDFKKTKTKTLPLAEIRQVRVD